MQLKSTLLLAAAVANAAPVPYPAKVPSVEEAAVEVRTLVSRESLSNVATIVQKGDLAGTPESFMEYYADCGDADGSLTLLAIKMSTTYKNVEAGSPATISIRVGDHPLGTHVNPNYPGGIPLSPAGSPRVSLRGKFVHVPTDDEEANLKLTQCFTKRHPDARFWLPGNKVHSSEFVKFKVDGVYFVGGFGDRAYIGEIPADLYKSSLPFTSKEKCPKAEKARAEAEAEAEEEDSSLVGSLWNKVYSLYNKVEQQVKPFFKQTSANSGLVNNQNQEGQKIFVHPRPIRLTKEQIHKIHHSGLTKEEIYAIHHSGMNKQHHSKEKVFAAHHNGMSMEDAEAHSEEQILKAHHSGAKPFTEEQLVAIHHSGAKSEEELMEKFHGNNVHGKAHSEEEVFAAHHNGMTKEEATAHSEEQVIKAHHSGAKPFTEEQLVAIHHSGAKSEEELMEKFHGKNVHA